MIDPDDPEFDLAEKIINAIFDLESNDQGKKDLNFDKKEINFQAWIDFRVYRCSQTTLLTCFNK